MPKVKKTQKNLYFHFTGFHFVLFPFRSSTLWLLLSKWKATGPEACLQYDLSSDLSFPHSAKPPLPTQCQLGVPCFCALRPLDLWISVTVSYCLHYCGFISYL